MPRSTVRLLRRRPWSHLQVLTLHFYSSASVAGSSRHCRRLKPRFSLLLLHTISESARRAGNQTDPLLESCCCLSSKAGASPMKTDQRGLRTAKDMYSFSDAKAREDLTQQ